jgi:hypothetical protein
MMGQFDNGMCVLENQLDISQVDISVSFIKSSARQKETLSQPAAKTKRYGSGTSKQDFAIKHCVDIPTKWSAPSFRLKEI